MDEEKSIVETVASATYDAAEKPFDFVEEGQETALICEPDPEVRSIIAGQIEENGYLVTQAGSAQEALKNMRFHTYDLVVINENFDAANPDENEVLAYLAELNMQIRRKMFVVLLGSRFRTGDNMAAFNKSVNLTLNLSNVRDSGKIIKSAVAENKAFYHVYMETLKATGRG